MGLVAVGSSLGGTIIPITAHNLIPILGLVGTYISFIVMVFNVFIQVSMDDANHRVYSALRPDDGEPCENICGY